MNWELVLRGDISSRQIMDETISIFYFLFCISSRQIKESISNLNFFPPNRGVDSFAPNRGVDGELEAVGG